MKKIVFSALIIFSVLVFFACGEKQDTSPCTGTEALPMNLRIVNAAGQDMLKPTSSFYSVANMSLTFSIGAQNYNLSLTLGQVGTDTFYLKTGAELWSSGGQEMYLKLSPTDTDTIYARNDMGADGMNCKSYTFVSFKYNGIEVPRTTATSVPGGYFQIRK